MSARFTVSDLQDDADVTAIDDNERVGGTSAHFACIEVVTRMDGEANGDCETRLTFVLRALNAHDALIASLRETLELCDKGPSAIVDRARAALLRAAS